MPVLDIECQLARGQITRYLDGASFPGESLKQLNAHISECPTCMALLADRRSLLEARVNEERTVRAVAEVQVPVETPMPSPTPSSFFAQLKNQIGVKPLVLGGTLVLVLVAMSAVSKNMTGFLGPKVGTFADLVSSIPAVSKASIPEKTASPVKSAVVAPTETKPLQAATKIPTPTPPKPVEAKKSANLPTVATVAAPVATHAAVAKPAPKPSAPKPSAPVSAQPNSTQPKASAAAPAKGRLGKARTWRARRHLASHRTAWSSGIRVYAPNGNPVQ